MSEVSFQPTRSRAGHAVQLALALMERLVARMALRRLQRQQADERVVMGV